MINYRLNKSTHKFKISTPRYNNLLKIKKIEFMFSIVDIEAN